MRRLSRRAALRRITGACAAMMLGDAVAVSTRSRLGIVLYALGIHQQHNWEGRHAGLSPALAFLEECRRFRAGGVQCPFGPKDAPQVAEFRRRAEQYQMRVEAILNPPRDGADLERFENDLKLAKEAGASLARTVIIPGRRYERFKTLAEFRQFETRGLQSLQRAEPVLSRHKFRLAVENHKDQLIAEKLETLRRVGSEWIGLCVDVGNNVALMEEPLETVRAFAPLAFTVHLKDLAVQEYDEGWLLADVALGDGFLPLKEVVDTVRRARPDVGFYLETITRDPLKIPFRTDAFWATLPGNREETLARMNSIVNRKSVASVRSLPVAQQLQLERRNIERSFVYAQEHLSL